jgi:carbamoyl-phosphate synthase large subunit
MVVRKRRMGHGAKFVHILRSSEDRSAVAHFDETAVIATEFLEGEEFTVDILSDLEGNVLAVLPRLRRMVRHGIVHFAELVQDPLVIDTASVLATKLGLTGINCVQCIRTASTCDYFEVNPRPGSGIDLSVAAGVNLPALWVRLVHGEPVRVSEPNWGLKLIRTYDGYFFK